jgi:hypothetical protein
MKAKTGNYGETPAERKELATKMLRHYNDTIERYSRARYYEGVYYDSWKGVVASSEVQILFWQNKLEEAQLEEAKRFLCWNEQDRHWEKTVLFNQIPVLEEYNDLPALVPLDTELTD